MVVWSKDHVMAICVVNLESRKFLWNSLIGDRTRCLGVKQRTIGWVGWRE
jgi:hypothetical protein